MEPESKEKKKTKVPFASELRQDIVTGDYVVVATGRSRRPDDFIKPARIHSDENHDPFENPEQSAQEKDVLMYRRDDGEWSLRVFPNKFPAVSGGKTVIDLSEGPYAAKNGVGYHEVVVTRDRGKSIASMEPWQVVEIIDAYQERYLSLMNKRAVNYIQIFHNHGKEAGASLSHPHSQLMAIPVVSPYIELELKGSEKYYRTSKHDVFGVIVEYERKAKKRMVFENEHFVAFCPFASRVAFEVWIVGKRKNPYFERMTEEEKFAVSEALQQTLKSVYEGLNDPPYNFYIHTAPCDGKDYPLFPVEW